MSVLVFIEYKNKVSKAALEAVSYGSKIGKVSVVTYGNIDSSELEILGKYGAEKVLVHKGISSSNDQQITKLVAAAADQENSNVIVLAQDQTGKSIGPRIAAKLSAGHISGAIALPDTSNGFVVKTNVYSGKAFAHISVNTPIKVISLLANSLPPEMNEKTAQIVDFDADLGDARITVKEMKTQGEGIPLPEAELVVSAGRGLKGPENWGIVEELAESLGATTACSRPVADIGWRPHHEHVGQTGIAIRPNLYIAAGISGAIQHLAGVNGSKVIVVINTDSEAPFFKAADYGIVGDAFEVLPKLTEALNNFKASQN
ncbi:MAG: electron transfer flavoprotein subunit alpha [Crocinitomicaceae bacterium]|nr:electron transfer flavoprotein subunit alpha [Crocinitomicaceae bacterium]|tara:strand:- start:2604 stop:3551 length:948 start_codon:yes stop_codon:yes gene_type:complete